ncbi:MAG: TonB-dependent receptor plug domain-containing protein, partial [Flavobacteriales bacterium]
MIFLKNMLLYVFILISPIAFCQTGDIHASVKKESEPVVFATLSIEELSVSSVTTSSGKAHLHDIPYGTYTITASYIGYELVSQEITLSSDSPNLNLEFSLTEQTMDLDEIVISGTKTYKRQTDSPVIVNVLSSKTLDNVQACNLSEGLKFQPGLRVENDCQTCNYTQLRMNGLAGGYSQILINGRPIFSPLTGLYGMEQLPVNMIERIEVVRGGGSSLYGSSAIGGTVNVITKTPRKNSYELNYNYQNINKQTGDNQTLANATLVSKS